MNIGEKIKRLRMELQLTQAELADRTELTKGYISQVERDLASPSIATLQDLLEALGTNLGEFFSGDESDRKVVFKKADVFVKEEPDYGMAINWIVPNAQKNEMEPIIIELEAGGMSYDDEPHHGEEFGYVLTGEVELVLGQNRYKVKKGESFYYKADMEHMIKNSSKEPATILWVAMPPTF
ncbi:MAG: cupin domain-containing protein [Turicibacter sp.]|nr:cupin domain-containing protein [Turicibacter sp.]